MKRLNSVICSIVAVGALTGHAAGNTLSLGTSGNAANWLVTGAGAVGSPAFQVTRGPGESRAPAAGQISITSDASQYGTFASGGSLADFSGFWYADEMFFLPSDAADVSLGFDSLWGNDRTVLELNDNPIGNANYYGYTGTGVMSFPPGPQTVAYTFTNTTSGTVTSGFLFGAMNDLRLVVNNTGTGQLNSPTATFQFAEDYTDATVNATLSYNIVPEPCTLALLGVGAVSLAGWAWRRRRATRRAKPQAFAQQDAPAILAFPSHPSLASAARRAA